MGVKQLAEKNYEEVPVQEVKETKPANPAKMKLVSIVSVWISFVVLYFSVISGNETFMWSALGLLTACTGFLYVKN